MAKMMSNLDTYALLRRQHFSFFAVVIPHLLRQQKLRPRAQKYTEKLGKAWRCICFTTDC